MKISEILELLKKFGLNEYESKVYVNLLLLGPSKAGEISKEAGVPQSKIYEVLDCLMHKQLVEMFDGRPKEFRAIPSRAGLKNLANEMERKVDFLKTKIDEMDKVLKPINTKQGILEGVWTHKGEKWIEFFNRISDMLDNCNNYAYGMTRDFSYTSRLRQAVKDCMKRGVKLKIIGVGKVDERNYFRAKWYKIHNVPLRVFETKSHPRILLIDGKEVCIRLDDSYDPSKKRFRFHSLWSQDPALVKVMDSYMKNLWSTSKPVNFNSIPKPKTQ